VEARLRTVLAGQGLSEVVNYSFLSMAELEAFQATDRAIIVDNPLSAEQGVMRTTLLPSLVQNVTRAFRHQASGVRFYELARSYHAHPGGGVNHLPAAHEQLQVAGVVWGTRDGRRTWTGGDAAADFFDAKATVEAVLEALHITGVSYEALESPWYHPRAAAKVVRGGATLGTIGELHPRVVKKLDAPTGVFLFQLDVEALQKAAALVPQATALSKFPAVLRDLAVVVPAELGSDKVRDVILEVGKPLVEDAQIFDVYTGAQVGEGKKNLAYALRYRSPEKTLTDAEVTEAHSRVVAEVSKRLGGSLRA
jgi:phenylalanyl-tRNA synthetase beta chain